MLKKLGAVLVSLFLMAPSLVLGQTVTIRDATSPTQRLAIDSSGRITITGVLTGTSVVTGSGTAGTPAAGVITIQGIASMTAVKVDGSAVTQPVSGTFWQTTQPISGALTDSQLRSSAVPISVVSLPLPSGAATATLQGGGLPAALGAGGGLKVDGSGTALPVSGTLTGVTTVSTVTNLSQQGGVAISLNTGVRDTGTQRVTIATDDSVPVTGTFWQTTQPVSGTLTGVTTVSTVTNLAQIAGVAPIVKAASTPSVTTDPSLVVQEIPLADPVCTSFVSVNQTATSTTITGTASKRIYVCSVVLVSATAQSISLAEGTGTTCGTGKSQIAGGSGGTMALSANGGLVAASPKPFLKTGVDADNLCVEQSGAGNVSGVITYVIQ